MTFEEWKKLIEEFEKSGKSQAQWCREKNLKVKAFNFQYIKYKKIKQNEFSDKQINWMPVKLESLTIPKLSIRLGRAVIEIEDGYDERLLQSMVKSLEAIC